MAENMNENVETIGEGVGFERIRRITGYLVGTLDRFNNAKRAEVQDRVKHSITMPVESLKKGA
jgi:anaerobic ribonucleoside-triphosphate reductase